jgi:GntR family transcriptional regulator
MRRSQLRRQSVLNALHMLGIVPVAAEQTTTAVRADAITAQHLGVDHSSALLCVHRLIRDAQGQSIEHRTTVYRPDRCHLRTSIAIEQSPDGLRWSDTQSIPRMPAWL